MTAFPTSFPPRLAGKVALVTGATQGIGGAIAKLFAQHGARVIVNALVRDARAEAFAAEIGSSAGNGDNILLVQADVRDRAQIDAMVAAGVERFGGIDVLVNNAGINVFSDPLKLSEDDWARCLSVDLEGAWHCARAVLPHMLARGAGSIVKVGGQARLCSVLEVRIDMPMYVNQDTIEEGDVLTIKEKPKRARLPA